MSMTVTDTRASAILSAITKGMTRDQIAEMQGHKDRQAIDQYMRRRGYVWDATKQTYVPREEQTRYQGASTFRLVSSRAMDVIAAFDEPDADPVEIAKQLRFSDHRSMAAFMTQKGYTWSSEAENYVPTGAPVAIPVRTAKESAEGHDEAMPEGTSAEWNTPTGGEPHVDWGQYLGLLNWLKEHEGQLTSVVQQEVPEEMEIPRYTVPGICMIKSVHMVSGMAQLVKAYSRQKGISQRAIFETALIQFFKRYGFAQEVDQLLASK